MVITKTLDVKLAGSQWVTEAVKGEANARTLHIAFEEEGHSLSLENVAHAYLYARKPSGQYSLINSCTINADNTIDYVETAQTCAEQGIMLCTLVLVDEDGATLYSPQFTIHIFPNELDQSGIVSASEFTAINEQVASADNSRKRAEAWAVGTMDGEPVPSDDETYENNSKYYAEQAEQIKNETQGIADDVDEIRDDVLAIKEQAQEIVDDACDKVLDMTATAHQISVNAQPTVSKTGGDSTPINLDFGMPAPNGIKSIVKTQTVGLNDIYKITFTNNNTFEYVVKNGKDGDSLSAGTGINISNDTISLDTTGATAGQVLKKTANGVGWANESGGGESYTAGTGISIANNAISINTSGASTGQVLKKTSNGVGWANESGGSSYTAGTGISISNNAIAINTSGASTGQVLKKTSSGVGWANESTGTNVVANPTLAGTEDALEGIQVGSTKYVNRPSSMSYITEEPTADNTDGIKIVVLTYEPDTKYDGYIYLIAPWQGTDLTGTIWKLRDRVPDPIEGFDLDFTSNNETFTGLRCEDTPRHLDYNRGEVLYDTIMTSDDVTPTWVNQNYRILNIIDGSGVSAEVIAWFQKNASYEGEI